LFRRPRFGGAFVVHGTRCVYPGMNGRQLIPLAALGAAAVAAGCGSSSSYGGSGNGSTATPASQVTSAKAPTLAVKNTSLGRALVDSQGRTLYMFGHDTKDKSRCSGDCATNWPPAASPAKPKVGSGVTKSKLKVIRRSDGSRQLSYAGRPLYRFAGDSKAGDVKGQGINAFGGVWNLVAPSGTAITKAAGSGSSSSGGGGYGGGGY
jgi:predicted lipoprotein with Yx(FWY)xxD motif